MVVIVVVYVVWPIWWDGWEAGGLAGAGMVWRGEGKGVHEDGSELPFLGDGEFCYVKARAALAT